MFLSFLDRWVARPIDKTLYAPAVRLSVSKATNHAAHQAFMGVPQ